MLPDDIPPIDYIEDDNGQKYIVDGNHRFFAALKRGDSEILAERFDILGEEEKHELLNLFTK